MALRASTSSTSSSSSSTNSLLNRLPLFWHEASNSSSMEWKKWIDLFAVAMMAKYSISMNELTRTADETNPKAKALLGDMPEEAANKKAVSMMFLSLGEAGRKMFRDKYPEKTIWSLQAIKMLQCCEGCFRIERNRTLDRHHFLSREHNRKKCYRCGAVNFNLEHLKKCPAKNHQCKFCSIMGHWENAVTKNIHKEIETCNKE